MKHIATYPLYGTMTRNRVGTGYIYRAEEIAKIRHRLEQRGHPLRIRWRNEECRIAALAILTEQALP